MLNNAIYLKSFIYLTKKLISLLHHTIVMKTVNLANFEPISLDRMKTVKLMNRVDVKYVTTVEKLSELLQIISDQYFVQETAGMRNLPYSTVYFDTDSIDMFNEHQRGKSARQKIRIRTYGSTGVRFLEIKQKNNKGRTKKKRIELESLNAGVADHADFIEKNSRYHSTELATKLENHFHRITLVNYAMTERLTIDTGLSFHNLSTGTDFALNNIAIIELKRDGLCPSPILEKLKILRIHSSGFSKYCMGMALTDPNLRQNRLKPRVRFVKQLNNKQPN